MFWRLQGICLHPFLMGLVKISTFEFNLYEFRGK